MRLVCLKRALTLVEVAAALALLATLLVATLAGFSRQAQQIGRSRLRLEAIELADRLLHDWTSLEGGIPVPAQGAFPARSDLQWQTTLADRSYRAPLGIDVVRFEVRDAHAAAEQPPLVRLELFVPAAMPPAPVPTASQQQRST